MATTASSSPLEVATTILNARASGTPRDINIISSLATQDLQHRIYFLGDTLAPELLPQWQMDESHAAISAHWLGHFPRCTPVYEKAIDITTRRARILWHSGPQGSWAIELEASPEGWRYHNTLQVADMEDWSVSEGAPTTTSTAASIPATTHQPLHQDDADEDNDGDDSYWDMYAGNDPVPAPDTPGPLSHDRDQDLPSDDEDASYWDRLGQDCLTPALEEEGEEEGIASVETHTEDVSPSSIPYPTYPYAMAIQGDIPEDIPKVIPTMASISIPSTKVDIRQRLQDLWREASALGVERMEFVALAQDACLS